MNITISKEHEGKDVYAIPTGNNARRFVLKQDPVIQFHVVKVKRKYVELRRENDFVDSYDPATGVTQKSINSGYTSNSGYLFFASREDLEDYKTYNRKIAEIRDVTRYRHLDLTLSDVETIHDILFRSKRHH